MGGGGISDLAEMRVFGLGEMRVFRTWRNGGGGVFQTWSNLRVFRTWQNEGISDLAK